MEWLSRSRILALGALCFGLGLSPAGSRAQFGSSSPPVPPSGGAALAQGTANTTGMGGFGNSNANAMMNPLMNPMMMMSMMPNQTTTPQANVQNAALMFMAANQMNGGIGSGRLGGPNAGKKPHPSAVAQATKPSGSNTPGAGASRYFNRGVASTTTAVQYYSRQNSHYPTNGR